MIRRLQTAEEIEKKRKKNQYIVGGVLIVLMIFSTLGFALISNQDSASKAIKENGIEFTRENGVWNFDLNGQSYFAQNLPSQVSNIEINGTSSLSEYINQPLYLVNPDSQAASLVLNFLSKYTLRYQEACLANQTCTKDLPSKTCSDNLIIFEESNQSSIIKTEKCTFLKGDLIKSADAFMYKTLNII